MKYSRMLFLPKNDSFLVNMLPVIENSVKNGENMKFLTYCWKYVRAYLSLGIYSLIDVYANEYPEALVIYLSNGGALFLFRHSRLPIFVPDTVPFLYPFLGNDKECYGMTDRVSLWYSSNWELQGPIGKHGINLRQLVPFRHRQRSWVRIFQTGCLECCVVHGCT